MALIRDYAKTKTLIIPHIVCVEQQHGDTLEITTVSGDKFTIIANKTEIESAIANYWMRGGTERRHQ